MIVAETPRLILRHVERGDAPFVLALLTDADFLAHIGDRGVRDLADAERWAGETMPATVAEKGFGMFAVVERESGEAIGIAGLVDRDGLDHVDLGYALLPAARGKGYATEAGRAVLDWAAMLGLAPIVAIVGLANARSVFVLDRLGFVADAPVRLPGADEEVMLYRRPVDSDDGDDMLLAALLLAHGAPASAPARCDPEDAALPPALAGWTAPRPFGDLRPGSALTLRLGGRPAQTRFSVALAGTYGIAIDQRARIDVYPAHGSRPLVAMSETPGPACSGIHAIMRFSLPRGSYRVVVSGVQRPTARVMLVDRE